MSILLLLKLLIYFKIIFPVAYLLVYRKHLILKRFSCRGDKLFVESVRIRPKKITELLVIYTLYTEAVSHQPMNKYMYMSPFRVKFRV